MSISEPVEGVWRSLSRNRRLAFDMAVRDMRILTKGSYLGLFWLVLRPLLQVATYVFIISVIFGIRFGEGVGTFDYAIFILGGLVPWQATSKLLEEAPSMVSDQMDLLKQVSYPIEIIPVVRLIVASVGLAVGLTVYFVLSTYTGGAQLTWLLLPLPVIILTIFSLGLCWVFMLLGVIFKDLKEIVAIITGIMIFVSPVLISEKMANAEIWFVLQFNPFTHFIMLFRDVLESSFHPANWVIAILMACATSLFGSWLVKRTKLRIREYI